jgi:hypothetical protein
VTTKELAEYHRAAVPISVRVDDFMVKAYPKAFKTGSLGWHHSGKIALLVGDLYLTCQVSLCVTCVGSKELCENGVESSDPECTQALLPSRGEETGTSLSETPPVEPVNEKRTPQKRAKAHVGSVSREEGGAAVSPP